MGESTLAVTSRGAVAELRGITVTGGGGPDCAIVIPRASELYPSEQPGELTLVKVVVSGNGCGIYNNGTAILIRSQVSENASTTYAGGAIRNTGKMTLVDSMVANNTSLNRAAGIDNNGKLALVHSTVSDNVSDRHSSIDNVGTIIALGTVVADDCDTEDPIRGSFNVESPGDTCGFDPEDNEVNVSREDLNIPLAY